MVVPTTIRNSSIEGVGVFAGCKIPAGSIIWRLDERFDLVYPISLLETFPDNMRDYFDRYGYPHMTRDGVVVLEVDNGRFMNHSETPNTNFTHPEVGWAIRDICEGEEITCNYAEFDRSFRGFHSNCNSVSQEPMAAAPAPAE